ncbi:hypothetical protein [Candidatus Methanoperedens sp. BLZ2]|nr:hypothetical protein [Candidatus Methanoperedens sp. BLZ2]KAB2942395.1 MAG: hypothetical protein F9K14_17245 [Candidatus Methanoperedens sp.]MBZ0176665.1 hypothetical protein [Candidatus Methanoperedens nitroreducens]
MIDKRKFLHRITEEYENLVPEVKSMTHIHVFKCTGCGWEARISEENMRFVGGSVDCRGEPDGLGCGYACVFDHIEIEDGKGNVTAVIV